MHARPLSHSSLRRRCMLYTSCLALVALLGLFWITTLWRVAPSPHSPDASPVPAAVRAPVPPTPPASSPGPSAGDASRARSFPASDDAVSPWPGCMGTRGCCRRLTDSLQRLNCTFDGAAAGSDGSDVRCMKGSTVTYPLPAMGLEAFWSHAPFEPDHYVHARAFIGAADADCVDAPAAALPDRAIIHCDPVNLPAFARALPRLRARFFLLTHLRDMRIAPDNRDVRRLLDSPLLLHWFGINVDCVHPKLTPIPIGVNFAAARDVFNVSRYRAALPPAELAYSLFGIGANQRCRPGSPRSACARRKVLAQLQRNGVSNLSAKVLQHIRAGADIKIPRAEYLERQLGCKYIISPQGNGIDCFRTWESLYLGRSPVVHRNNMSGLYEGLPVLVVDDWEGVTPALLEAGWREMARRRYDWSRMSIVWWWRLLMRHCVGAGPA